jgi:hypothetical protein
MHDLTLTAFASWLITECLGAYMLARVVARGGRGRRRVRGVSPTVLFGHAGLAFAGFLSWVTFWLTGSAAIAWLAVGLLGPAIGLGISAVTVWTPFPVRGAEPDGPAGAEPEAPTGAAPSAGISNDGLVRALADEALAGQLVDDLLAGMLATPARPVRWRAAPLIAAAHGVFAIGTFLFAMLAAVAAIAHS